jgi:RND family efflux transporter MFP subunit
MQRIEWASRVFMSTGIMFLACGCQRGGTPAVPGDAAGTPAGETSAALTRVTPIRPVRKTLIRRTEQPGQVEAFEETPLYAKVAGYVQSIPVDIGDTVAGPRHDPQGRLIDAGQVLVELSIPELEQEYQQKQALVGQAQAEVRQGAAAVRVAEAALAAAQARVEETRAAIARTQADFDRFQSELARVQELATKGALTQQVADEKRNQFRAADAARGETAAKILSAQAAVTESTALLDKAQADHEALKAKLRVAQAEERRVAALMEYRHIRAPYDGVVAVRNVHTGHLVQPGTGSGGKPLLVLIRVDKVRIFVDVPEADAVLTRRDGEARIRIPSMSAETFTGTVTRTAWMLNAGTRTLRTEIDRDNPDGRLRPGMFVVADLKVAERPDALALPHTALWSADGQTFCYTIDSSGKVTRQPVEAGIRAGDEVEIISGLTGNEQVIGTNPAAFRDGQQVEVVAPTSK